MGNGTTGGKRYVNVDSSTSPQNFKIYLAGNRMLNKDGSVYGDITYDNWKGITVKDGLGISKDSVKSGSAFGIDADGENISTAMKTESAEAAYDHVVNLQETASHLICVPLSTDSAQMKQRPVPDI